MEIDNKIAYREELKKIITDRIRQFPVFFYGNIFINIVLVFFILVTALAVAVYVREAVKLDLDPRIIIYGLMLIAVFLRIFSITVHNFLKNIRILAAIRAGGFDLEIKDYELDNVIEFFEDLPMSKEDFERVKMTLSFEKLINILELFNIISCDGKVCDVDIIFKHRTLESIGEDAIEEEKK